LAEQRDNRYIQSSINLRPDACFPSQRKIGAQGGKGGRRILRDGAATSGKFHFVIAKKEMKKNEEGNPDFSFYLFFPSFIVLSNLTVNNIVEKHTHTLTHTNKHEDFCRSINLYEASFVSAEISSDIQMKNEKKATAAKCTPFLLVRARTRKRRTSNLTFFRNGFSNKEWNGEESEENEGKLFVFFWLEIQFTCTKSAAFAYT
jgi:hypothetical protein